MIVEINVMSLSSYYQKNLKTIIMWKKKKNPTKFEFQSQWEQTQGKAFVTKVIGEGDLRQGHCQTLYTRLQRKKFKFIENYAALPQILIASSLAHEPPLHCGGANIFLLFFA